eukprot:4277724-Pyramimonas_sp.AAC.1
MEPQTSFQTIRSATTVLVPLHFGCLTSGLRNWPGWRSGSYVAAVAAPSTPRRRPRSGPGLRSGGCVAAVAAPSPPRNRTDVTASIAQHGLDRIYCA